MGKKKVEKDLSIISITHVPICDRGIKITGLPLLEVLVLLEATTMQ